MPENTPQQLPPEQPAERETKLTDVARLELDALHAMLHAHGETHPHQTAQPVEPGRNWERETPPEAKP